MTSFVAHTTIDCHDAYRLSEWWKQALGYEDLPDEPNRPGAEECMIHDPATGHRLLFIEVPDEHLPAKRVHLDLRPRAGSQIEAGQQFRGLSWPLRTERLVVRPARLEDSDALWQHRQLADVGTWLGWHPTDRGDWDQMYPSRYGEYLVVEHEGRIIGDLMLHVQNGWSQREVKRDAENVEAELGWSMHPDAGGQGFATEAVQALIEICFEGLGLRRVEAGAFALNEPSWRLMERVGMRREQYGIKKSLHRDHGWIDGVRYALLAEEWRAARSS